MSTKSCSRKEYHDYAGSSVANSSMVHPTFKFLIKNPRVFRVTENVLSNPLHGQVHPLSPKLMLMTCKISGDTSLTAAFLNQLPTSLCAHGDQVRKNSTMFTSASGLTSAFKGKLIQRYPL